MYKSRYHAGSRVLAVGLLVLMLAGCSKRHGVTLYPVRGKVLLNGEPAKDVNIMFSPVTPIEVEGHALAPAAVTEEDGSFRLMSFDPDDGAPAGDYTVTVIFPMSRYSKSLSGVDRLKGKFSDPKKSGLTAKVEAKANEVPVFNLKAEVLPMQDNTATGAKLYKKNRER